jgi:hypothetical protein
MTPTAMDFDESLGFRFCLYHPDADEGGSEFDVVASSDRAVIKRAKAVWDIPAELLRRKKANILDLKRFKIIDLIFSSRVL